MKAEYEKGYLASAKQHLTLISLELSNHDKYDDDKKYLITIRDEEEAKTLQQLRLIHSIFRLLHMANCMNERLDNEDKIKEMFKIKCGMIDKWGYVSDENRLLFVSEKAHVPLNKLAIPFSTSLAKASKKALRELIDYTLIYCDKQNIHGNLGAMEKKYIQIREELERR